MHGSSGAPSVPCSDAHGKWYNAYENSNQENGNDWTSTNDITHNAKAIDKGYMGTLGWPDQKSKDIFSNQQL